MSNNRHTHCKSNKPIGCINDFTVTQTKQWKLPMSYFAVYLVDKKKGKVKLVSEHLI